jgi:hypothetical protein
MKEPFPLSSREPVSFSIFRIFQHPPPDVLQPPWQSRHPERSASHIFRITEGLMARSRRTSAMLVSRCSSGLSGHKLQGDQKVTGSECTRISYFTALTGATYVVLPKENHMQLTEAATLDRKSTERSGVERFAGSL